MAFTSALVIQVMSGGLDGRGFSSGVAVGTGPTQAQNVTVSGGYGGGFDPGFYTGMATDGTAISANTSLPVFSSLSYAFKSTDVGAWVYVASGANWTPGWYNILSVAASAATVNAAPSGATYFRGGVITGGMAIIANPSGAIWSVDYSHQPTPRASYTDFTITSTNTSAGTSLANPFGINHVGNIVAISGGANFVNQRAVIASISASSIAVFDRAMSIVVSATGGQGALGGALASPGYAAVFTYPGNTVYIKNNGIYSISVNNTYQAAGRLQTAAGVQGLPVRLYGYNTVPGEDPALANRPVIQSGVAIGSSLVAMASHALVENLIFDGNGVLFSTNRAMNPQIGEDRIRRCLFKNFANNAIVHATNTQDFLLLDCEVTSCSSQPAISITNTSIINLINCYVHDNIVDGISCASAPTRLTCMNTIFANNKLGATKSHIIMTAANQHARLINCTFYNAGTHAIDIQAQGQVDIINNIFENNGGYGVNINTAARMPYVLLHNNAWTGNVSGNYDATKILLNRSVFADIINTSGSFFTGATSGNFMLNNTVNRGPLAQAAGFPSSYPGSITPSYLDVGAVQHQDTTNKLPLSYGTVF